MLKKEKSRATPRCVLPLVMKNTILRAKRELEKTDK
jgi:hypothetical protein